MNEYKTLWACFRGSRLLVQLSDWIRSFLTSSGGGGYPMRNNGSYYSKGRYGEIWNDENERMKDEKDENL